MHGWRAEFNFGMTLGSGCLGWPRRSRVLIGTAGWGRRKAIPSREESLTRERAGQRRGCSLEAKSSLGASDLTKCMMWVAVFQPRSRVPLFVTLWTAARQASLSITVSLSLLKLMPIQSVVPSNCLILCCPLLLLPSVFPSIRVFPSESAFNIRWPKYWSFGFNISLSNEHSELISFRIDWFDFLVVQRTLKSLPQSHSFKA